jgi:hypothetical protein
MIDDFLSEWDRRNALAHFSILTIALDNPSAFKSSSARNFRHMPILVDEFRIRTSSGILSGCFRPSIPANRILQSSAGPGNLYCRDPKQSIYRFRNADIETYLGIVGPRAWSLGLRLNDEFPLGSFHLSFVDAAFP